MVVLSLEQPQRTPRTTPVAACTTVQPDVGGSTPAEAASDAPREQRFIEGLRAEIDTYLVGLKRLASQPPEQVFTFLSGVSARLVEIRVQLWRVDSRRCSALRSREVDPLLEEIDRQFRLHSRLAAINQLEWEMTKAAPS